MKITAAAIFLGPIFLAACFRLQLQESAVTGEPKLAKYRPGDPVAFHLDGTIYYCAGLPTYSITQLIDNGQRELSLFHSCVGFVGTGIDQYCQNGQVKNVPVGACSDAIPCGEQSIHATILWDQKEIVTITEQCAGQTIHREIEQQVPIGKYQITAQMFLNDKITAVIIKEFEIVAEASGSK